MSIHQSELHRQASHYAAIKAKLYGRPANVNIKTKPIAVVEPEELPEPSEAPPAPQPLPRLIAQPKRVPTNMWEKARITFNQHVIDYRLYLFDKERRAAGYVEPENKSKGQKPVVPVKDRKPIIDIVLDVLEQFPGITVDELRGPGRTRRVVPPRQMAMFKLHKQRPDLSLPAIGRWFGGRDHTTVLHSIRRAEAQIARQEASK